MGMKTIRLEKDVYERVKQQKQDDETFSEAIDRILSDYTLTDFARDTSDEGTAEMEAALQRLNERGRAEPGARQQ
jgi:predicted CopG family antitoxin